MDNAPRQPPERWCTKCGQFPDCTYEYVCVANHGQPCENCCCAKCKQRMTCNLYWRWSCKCTADEPTKQGCSGDASDTHPV
eukprot:2066913-Rhodomonas_salina.1